MNTKLCWTSTCLHGDSLGWMRQQIVPFADLIIADPPFNIGWKYDAYQDKRASGDYLGWTTEWITEAKRLLKPTGNLLICMGDEYVSDIDVICRHTLKLSRQNWIVWHYSFGQSGTLESRTGFTRSKTHVLRYSLGKPYFNAAAVAEPSDRQLKYHDKRADPRGKCPNDVFIFKRVCGTHVERVRGVSTQMPVALLEKWVKAMCPEDGFVFDPFPGSGASLIAAKRLNRQYVGVELSETYHRLILARLAKA